jgi:hypothetical protein
VIAARGQSQRNESAIIERKCVVEGFDPLWRGQLVKSAGAKATEYSL